MNDTAIAEAAPALLVPDTWRRLVREVLTAGVLAVVAAGFILGHVLSPAGTLLLWAVALALPVGVVWRLHDWSPEEPYLIANHEGLWLKDWAALDVIDWADVALERIGRKQLRAVLAGGRLRYRTRLDETEIAQRKHLFVPRALVIDLRGLGADADGVARVLERLARVPA